MRDEAVLKRPETAERSVAIPSAEASMRILELAVGLIAGVAALLLGFGR